MPLYEQDCKHCGVRFQRQMGLSHYRRNPPKMCSRRCRDLAQTTRVALRCAQCQVVFERKAYMARWSRERGPFCGSQCYGAWQQENTHGEANPYYRPEAHLSVACDECGRNFHRIRSYRRGAHQFCSRDCFHSFAKENWKKPLPKGYGKSWPSRKRAALSRDGHECQDCGAQESLVVHHLRPYLDFEQAVEAHELGNLVTVCAACHRGRHNRLRSESR